MPNTLPLDAVAQTDSSANRAWPASPYKALSYYVEDDLPLFAGRERDIFECANLLSLSSTRILILHGNTGCGKSSFLRAGLIPFLESEGSGFQFLKSGKSTSVKPIFVRSTESPLIALAEEVYKFVEHDIERETPLGPSVLKLSEIVADYKGRNEFLEKVGRSAELMTQVLNDIARILPKTLILIIDQAEEVLTLRPGKLGAQDREEFFDFLARFSMSQYDLKLLVALRIEYFGFFYDAIRERNIETLRVRDFVLKNFSQDQVIEAITRPTSEDIVPHYGRPLDHYKFSFAPGLPKKIADDLENLVNSGNVSGGILPVMQVVCDRLYQKTVAKRAGPDESWIIEAEDYQSLGGIEEQIGEYLRVTLVDRCKEKRISESEIVNETARWRDVLSELARSQADGTVTTEVMREEDLSAAAERNKCLLNFGDTVEYLDKKRILRSVQKVDLETGKDLQCYSLAHDAIGLYLRRWKVTRQEARSNAARATRNLVWLGACTMVIGLIVFLFSKVFGASVAGYGLLLIVSAVFAKVDTYGRVPRWFLVLQVWAFPTVIRSAFVKDSFFRERLRQYPELSDKFESALTKQD